MRSSPFQHGFVTGTVENLEQNRFVSLVIWDSASDKGYQVLGEVEEIEEEAMMNGYAPELEFKGDDASG